jgi:hypothetical protein
MKIYIGIDPGKNGAIAFIPTDAKPWAVGFKDATDKDIFETVRDATVYADDERVETVAFLEQVGPGVFGAGKKGRMGVKSAFTFGEGFGKLVMLLTALEIPFERVRPLKWQTAMGCKTGGDKNVSKRRAQELFPEIKITHAIADALLIAEYARRTNL